MTDRHGAIPPPSPAPTPTRLTRDQECRAQAARAIGWQHPSHYDPPEYHDWFWTVLDSLAIYICTGQRPS